MVPIDLASCLVSDEKDRYPKCRDEDRCESLCDKAKQNGYPMGIKFAFFQLKTLSLSIRF